MRRHVVLWLSLLAVPASSASAFECTVGKTCLVSPRWATREATFRVEAPPSGSPLTHDELRAATRRAFARWGDVPCTDLVLREDERSPNVVRVALDQWRGRPGEAALTHVRFDSLRGDLRTATIDLNLVHHTFAAEACEPGALDLELVLTHEVGHFIGLAHPCEFEDEGTIMEPEGDGEHEPCPVESCDALVSSRGGVPATVLWPHVATCAELPRVRELGGDDVAGLCSIYPRGAEALPCVELPLQEAPYIENVPFGCSAGGARSGLLAALLLLGSLAFAARRRDPVTASPSSAR
jgi:hypothetical protein